MRFKLFCVSLAALAAATGCGDGAGSAEAQASELAVAPDEVSAEALRAAVSDERVKRFYEARAWSPAWTEEQAAALIAALQDAPRHGLSDAAFRKDAAAAATLSRFDRRRIFFCETASASTNDPRRSTSRVIPLTHLPRGVRARAG